MKSRRLRLCRSGARIFRASGLIAGCLLTQSLNSYPQHKPVFAPRKPLSLPYLVVMGSPALRTAEPLEPPTGRIPINPANKAPEITFEPAILKDLELGIPSLSLEEVIRRHSGDSSEENPNAEKASAPLIKRTEPSSNVPLSILPDDTPKSIDASDVLPYFLIPGAQTPATLPRSSATYTTQ